MRLKTGDTLGNYTIEEELGHGGMATVYRAYQASLQRYVAIKVLPEFFAEDRAFRERFAREAAIVAQLRHPNIVRVFDYGEEAGTPYIVTEFVPGETLSARLGQPLSVKDSLAILRPLAPALDYAHEQGVVHRDVKPSNVMVERDGTPILTDFGLARITGSLPRLTRTGTPVGTPEYMAPELANGDVATAAVDRYALAVVAYEMLTGSVPFTGETPLAVLLAHLNRPPPRPSRINPAISLEVEDVLQKALEKDPDDRYASASEFVEALAAADAKANARGDARSGPPAARPLSGPQALSPPPSSPAQSPAPIEIPGREYARLRTAPAVSAADDTIMAARSPRTRATLEALQHPTALLPMATATLALIYLVLLSPLMGYGLAAAILVLTTGPAAAVAAVLRYPREYDVAEEQHEHERERARQEREYLELRRLQETLQEGFSGITAPEGLKALAQLTNEFEQLRPALSRRRESDPLSMALLPALTVETYRRGLSVLSDALDLAITAHASEVERLEGEVTDLEGELAALIRDPSQAERVRMKEGSLAEHRELLRMLEEQKLHKDQLLYQAQRCEASLHRTRIDLTAIRTGSTDSSVDSVIQTLQRTIDQAKAVQAEIRKLGY